MNGEPLARHARLVAGLRRPEAWPFPIDGVRVIETHISTVLLAGDFAFKLKKPVSLGFLDFSTLALRRHWCEEEVRLNRRTAPALYLDVVAVAGTEDAPRFALDGAPAGPVLDHAVRMRRFADAALLDARARAGTLSAADIDGLADRVTAFHRDLPPADAHGPYGAPSLVHRWAADNVATLLAAGLDADLRARVQALGRWTDEEFDRRSHQFAARRHQGFVRECHGDLHLRNVALIDGEPVPFDCIEFNPELRWIDVVSELAFPFMDLVDHGLPRLAWRFINRAVEASGDFDGLATLRFYAVYRALVRGKVALIRARAPDVDEAGRRDAESAFVRHLALAERLARDAPGVVVLMHGFSGSGKSTVAQAIAEQLGAIRIRSDVERKRLHGLAGDAASGSAENAGLYATGGNERTYARLAECVRTVADAGYPAIVDAAFLRRADRAAMIAAARATGARVVIVDCRAEPALLRERIARRAAAGGDPSEATLAVLEGQLRSAEPFDATEAQLVIAIDTAADRDTLDAQAGSIAERLRRDGACASGSTGVAAGGTDPASRESGGMR